MAGKQDYSLEEIDLALTAFALEGGRAKATERLLLDAGLDIPWQTVKSWAYKTHHERYETIATEVESQNRIRLADNAFRLSVLATEAAEDFLQRIHDELARRDQELQQVGTRLADVESALVNLAGDATEEADDERKRLEEERVQLLTVQAALRPNLKELAKVLREATVLGGVSTDKHAHLTGRPTQIVQHDFSEIRAALERKGVRLLTGQGQPSQGPAGATATEVPIDRRLPPGDGDG